jgi:hypothetical protein
MSGQAAPATSLAPALRSLRLTGMLERLETRLSEARSGRLGHAESSRSLGGRDCTAGGIKCAAQVEGDALSDRGEL